MRRGRVAVAGVATIAAALGALLVAAPARADDPTGADATGGSGVGTPAVVQPVLLSTDGLVWRTSIDDRIFGTADPFVPGDERRASMLVRNPNAFPLAVDLRASHIRSSSPEVADALTAQGAVSGRGLAPATISALRECTRLSPVVLVAGETNVTLTVVVRMLEEASGAQSGAASFDVMVDASENAATVDASSCRPEEGVADGPLGDPPVVTGPAGPPGGPTLGGVSLPDDASSTALGSRTGDASALARRGRADAPSGIVHAVRGALLAVTGTDAGVALWLGGSGLLVGILFLLLGRRRRRRRGEETP